VKVAEILEQLSLNHLQNNLIIPNFQAQGALLVASVFEIIIGLSGILGVMLKYIGPLVISVTITLVGISLAELATNAASIQWGISIL